MNKPNALGERGRLQMCWSVLLNETRQDFDVKTATITSHEAESERTHFESLFLAYFP